MKNIVKKTALMVALVSLASMNTGCLDETFPQSSSATDDQVNGAPKAFQALVSACTSTLVGEFRFNASGQYPWDFGYPSFFLQRDVLGQDIALEGDGHEWFGNWYQVTTALGPEYLVCQVPWTYYYKWITNCNTVIKLAGDEPDKDRYAGVGIAYAMRAMFYMDLARMFQYTYKGNEQKPTVPIVTDKTTVEMGTNNPRATNEAMWTFILEDLTQAEKFIADYAREDVYTPDLSVVYGLKARAYLTMENWEKAEEYAVKAQAGYTPLSEAEYLDRMTAFNTPNHAWMFGLAYDAEDPNITVNDSDSNWGSQMFLEVGSGGLYASAYGAPKRIDAHLYQTIPATDFRKKCYADPALDAMEPADRTAALAAYTDYPANIDVAVSASQSKRYGCLAFKFRAGGGAEGRTNSYKATVVSVPLMRVEEMMLIEAEAAGMQNEGRGKTLLENFAKSRDPQYKYDDLKSFRDNIWWQRRVELWGEGFATFDIKRLNKGIVRSYKGSNHAADYRFNTDGVPAWMNLCIVNTEMNYNKGIEENNPTPVAPDGDSPEYNW